eukprot:TRINITY_DN369_c1_g1_i1.p1 TRINITY_DN369_c1_g1~~TRINITY_DN369_c1_g1_i1.p1  ORF type:complete len:417 (+),score=109.41 TRINITY_DN369_c1_g1_i1:57-1253(+)
MTVEQYETALLSQTTDNKGIISNPPPGFSIPNSSSTTTSTSTSTSTSPSTSTTSTNMQSPRYRPPAKRGSLQGIPEQQRTNEFADHYSAAYEERIVFMEDPELFGPGGNGNVYSMSRSSSDDTQDHTSSIQSQRTLGHSNSDSAVQQSKVGNLELGSDFFTVNPYQPSAISPRANIWFTGGQQQQTQSQPQAQSQSQSQTKSYVGFDDIQQMRHASYPNIFEHRFPSSHSDDQDMTISYSNDSMMSNDSSATFLSQSNSGHNGSGMDSGPGLFKSQSQHSVSNHQFNQFSSTPLFSNFASGTNQNSFFNQETGQQQQQPQQQLGGVFRKSKSEDSQPLGESIQPWAFTQADWGSIPASNFSSPSVSSSSTPREEEDSETTDEKLVSTLRLLDLEDDNE